MIEVRFLGPLKDKEVLKIDIKNLGELQELLSKDESLKPWLGVCALSVNDEVVSSLKEPLRDGDIICVLPPVCGG